MLLRLAALAVAPVVSGCGWQPTYAPPDGAAATTTALDLAAIEVRLIPERDGQLLREALQAELGRASAAVSRRYDLSVWYSVGSEAIGTRQDYSTSRLRYVGRAGFSLTTDRPTRRTLTSGLARAMDGANQFDEQYFASSLEEEAIHRRLATVIAQQIVLQLAAYFHRAAPGGPG